MPYTSAYEQYLQSLGETETPTSGAGAPFSSLDITPTVQDSDRGSLYDFLGNLTWGALDEAGFALPGAIAKKAGIEPITPETGLGSAGEILGRFGGFFLGAPMKVGVGAMRLAAKPFIKAAGKKTIAGVTRKVAGEGAKLAAEKGAKKGITDVVTQATSKYSTMNQKAKWSKDIAENFGTTSSNVMNKVVQNNVTKGVITRSEGDALKKIFKDNLTTQSFDDFIGMMQSKYPGKKGWVFGEMINEAVIWGVIDSAMEFPRSYSQDRPYDKWQPLWGIGIGSAMGSLNAFLPGGKSSSFRKDFMDGIKGVFNKSKFRSMSYEELVTSAKVHAGFLATTATKKSKDGKVIKAVFSRNVEYNGKNFDLDFRTPEKLELHTKDGKLIGNKAREEILRKGLMEETSKEGKELIRWAAKEEWENISDNWLRMTMAGAIMNMPVLTQLDDLEHLPPETLATQFMIGAFMGRKGLPNAMDLNLRVNHIRKGLSSLGIEPKQLIEEIPTWGASAVAELNPMNNHENLRDMQEIVRDAGIITSTKADFGRPMAPGEESARIASEREDLSLFNELHYYLKGTVKDGERIKSLDEISAQEARRIQNELKKKDWEILGGKKITDSEDMRIVMDDVVEQSAGLFEEQVVTTIKTILGDELGIQTITNNENIGVIPKSILAGETLRRQARDGELSFLVDADGNPLTGDTALTALENTVDKVNNLMKTVKEIGRAQENTNPKENIHYLDDVSQFETIRNYIQQAETIITNHLGNKIRIDFANPPEISSFLQMNTIKRGKRAIITLLDRSNPASDNIKTALINSGLLVEGNSLTDTFSLINDVSNIKITGADDASTESAYALLNSIHSLLKAKGQYDSHAPPGEIEISYNNIKEGAASLDNVLGSLGLNTNEGLLNMFTRDMVRTIITDNIAGTRLSITDIDQLIDLSIDGMGMVEYKSKEGVGFGFTIRKIHTLSTDAPTIAKVEDVNRIVQRIIDNGTKKDGSRVVVPDDDVMNITSKPILDNIHDVITKGIGEGARLTKKDLAELIGTIEGHDNFREKMIMFMNQHPHNAPKLMALLKANNLVVVNKGPGSKRYDFSDPDLLTEKMILKLGDKLTRMGLATSSVDAYLKEGEEAYHAMMRDDLDVSIGHKSKSQAEFFEEYFTGLRDASDQNQFIIDNIILEDGNINPNAIQDIMSKIIVETTQNGEPIKVGALDLTPGGALYRNVRADVASLVSTKTGSRNVKMIGYRDGGLDYVNSNIQDNGLVRFLDNIGVDFFILNPNMITRVPDRHGVPRRRTIDISSLHSKQNQHTDIEREIYKRFDNELKKQGKFEIDGQEYDLTGSDGEAGLFIMHIADWLPPMAFRKADKPKILAAWEDLVASKYSEEGTYRRTMSQDTIKRINDLTNNMRTEEQAFDYHQDALRSMMIEKMIGATRFLKLLNDDKSGDYKKLAKRLSLYYTPSAKRINADHIDMMENLAVTQQEVDIVSKYKTQQGFGMAVFDDSVSGVSTRIEGAGTSVKDRFQETLDRIYGPGEKKWSDFQGDRDDQSSFDSISYISTDFARFLSMQQGMDFDGTHFIWKPIISSDTPGREAYVKTVFIHDPTIQHVFTKNQGLDVLVSKTAVKIGAEDGFTFGGRSAGGEQGLAIRMPMNDIFNPNNADNFLRTGVDRVVNMEWETLGIVQAPKKEANAKVSHALWNYADSRTSGAIYDTYIGESLRGAMEKIDRMMSNPATLRMAMLDLQGVDSDFGLSAMMESSAGGRNMGAFIKFLQSSEFANPMAFEERIVMNILKRKMIDPIVTPESSFNGRRFGGQAVLMQSLNPEFRDLKQTIVNDKTAEIVQFGEVVLPHYELEQSIRGLEDRNLEVKIIKRNDGATPDEILTMDDFGKVQNVDDATSLSDLYDVMDTIDGGQTYQIAVTTARYPRTRPNDLMILGVKRFLDEDFGNAMIINDYDVLTVFEGDYDVDKGHYMWLNSDEVFNHIADMREYWIPGVNPDQFSPSVPELRLVSQNSTLANQAWAESTSDVKAYKGAIGMVQKMTRQVSHLRGLSSTVNLTPDLKTETNVGVLFHSQDRNGNDVRIVMDYDNKEWFVRTALESQAMIDAQADPSMFTSIEKWKDEYLFPLLDESISRSQLRENQIGFLRERDRRQRPNTDKIERIRLFKKVDKDGKEVTENLSDVEKDIIRAMITEHGRMLQLTTDVYDGSGTSRKADYGNIIEYSRDYFKYMRDLNQGIYRKLRKKYKRSSLFRALFPEKKVYTKKYNPKTKKWEDNKEYMWLEPGEGPMDRDAVERGRRIADGQGGSPLERSLFQIESRDPLNTRRRIPRLRDEFSRLDDTLDKFLEGAIDENAFADAIMGAFQKKNEAINAIKWAKRQVYRSKTDKQVEALNKIIREKEKYLEETLSVQLSQKYKESGKAKDLPEYGRLINIETDADYREGTIQYYALAPEISNFVPATNKHGGFGEDLAKIKNLERAWFADEATLGESLPYGEKKTILTSEQRTRLKLRPDQDMYNEIFTEHMDQMIDKHGLMFLWHYGAPQQKTAQAGIYNGRLMPIATRTSKRYKRMLNYLGRKAAEDPYMAKVLSILSKRDGIYRNLFSGNTHLIDTTPDGMLDHMFRIPNFGSEMMSMYDSYTNIYMDREGGMINPYRSGPSFDHALAFFKNVYKLAGREGEFDTAAEGISRMRELMMDNRLTDPMTFASTMAQMNSDIFNFISQRFNSKRTATGEVPMITDKNLLNNELFIMMGGNTHTGNGVTLSPINAMSHGKALWGEIMARQASEISSTPSKGRLDNFFNCRKVK